MVGGVEAMAGGCRKEDYGVESDRKMQKNKENWRIG